MAEGMRILVVDDEPMMLEIIAALLEGEGYQVQLADGGEKALAAAQQRAPDLVLCDLRMPGMSGWDLITALKDFQPRPPVLAMSGMGTQEPPGLRAIGSHVVGYMSKPFSVDELLRTVASALEVARERSAAVEIADERRKDRRRPLVVPVTLFTKSGTPIAVGQIVDIGAGGAQVHLGVSLHSGSTLELAFEIPGGHGPFRVAAQIQWNKDGRLGLMFEDLAEGDRGRLTQLLAED